MFDFTDMHASNWEQLFTRILGTSPSDWRTLRSIMRTYMRALRRNPGYSPDGAHLSRSDDPMFPLRRRAWILACYAHQYPAKWPTMLASIEQRRIAVHGAAGKDEQSRLKRRREYMREYMQTYRAGEPRKPGSKGSSKQSRADYMREYRHKQKLLRLGMLPDEAVQQVTPEDIERHNALARAKAKE